MKFRIARSSGHGSNEKPCDEAVYQHTGEGKDTFDWVVELNDLDELTKFCEEYGEVIIKPATSNESSWRLEIYDDYRE